MVYNLLLENESAFDIRYCIAFKVMDDKWLTMRDSYMDFNVAFLLHIALTLRDQLSLQRLSVSKFVFVWQTVLKSTRHQLERELLLEDVTRVQDLPCFNLLLQKELEYISQLKI